jgi:hypothetical protein
MHDVWMLRPIVRLAHDDRVGVSGGRFSESIRVLVVNLWFLFGHGVDYSASQV